MILTCQKCSTTFRLDETLLKATGSKVRCSLCQNMWLAFPPESMPEGGPAHGEDASRTAMTGAAAMGAAGAGLADDAFDAAETPADSTPELKFFADDAFGDEITEEEYLVTDEVNLDELDQLLREEGEPFSGPKPDDDFKTEELDLADLEKMLAFDADQPTESDIEPAVPENLDLDDALADELDAVPLENEDSVIEELDLDLEDLENLLEEDTGLQDEIAAADESTGGHGETADSLQPEQADTGGEEIDLDNTLNTLLEEDDRTPAIGETEEESAAEMEDVLSKSGTVLPEAEDDQELDFELAPGLDGIFDEGDGKDVPIEETEELDFSDLNADLEAAGQTPEIEEEDLELELEAETDEDHPGGLGELDDLELFLDEDGGTDKPDADVPELDLSALSRALGAETTGEAAAVAAAGEAEPEMELEMDFGEGDEADDDAFDLGLDETPAASSEPSGETGEETRELDVDELESLLAKAGGEAGQDQEESSDSLALDIDLDHLEADDADGLEDATRELDLNDIEKILEMDRTGANDAETGGSPEDFDLDLDLDGVAPAAGKKDAGEETAGKDAALDLSELEKMLDVEDTTDAPGGADDDLDDLDLDFELQPATSESEEFDLEFDMLDEEPSEASALFDTSESEDLGLEIEGGQSEDPAPDLESDLDFEIIDEDRAVEEVDLDLHDEEIGAATLSEATAAGGAARTARGAGNRDLTQELMDEMAAADTQTMKAPPMEAKPIKPVPPTIRRKKKSNVGLVLLLLLVLLGGAAYLVPKYTNIELPTIPLPDLSGVPFIGTFFTPPEPEAVVPVEASLKGEWLQNAHAGRIYMVQGQVRNEYESPRSYIRITGRVYANGRQFQRAETAYCGNILTPEQLATMPLADIQTLLSNRNGIDNRNVKVAPGENVPFMVVFGDLPSDVELQEFAVEISGSLPVAAAN